MTKEYPKTNKVDGQTSENRLAAARRLMEGEGCPPTSGQISEGARIVRELAEKDD